MTRGASKKILAILLLIGFILPQFSALALLDDILGNNECALKNKLKAFLEGAISKVVDLIKDLIKGIVCGLIAFFTVGLVNCKVTKTESGEQEVLVAKETIEDVIARCIARQALTRMTGGILDIIRGKGRDLRLDGSQSPVYIENWRNFTLQGQQRGENIWRGLLYIAAYGDPDYEIPPPLCAHIRESEVFNSLQPTKVDNLIQSGLNRRVNSLEEYIIAAQCDPMVEDNYDTFTQDFSEGGSWDMLELLSLPQNNIFGAIELANEELIRQRSIEEKANIDEATAHGFLGKRGESASDSCLSFNTTGGCIIYKDIQTPGFTLAESTNAIINSELNWITSSDEIHELLTDMYSIMIARLSNLSESDPARPPIELDPDPPETISGSSDPETLCINQCYVSYCTGSTRYYPCPNTPQLNTCLAACYGGTSSAPPGGGGGGICSGQGGTANYTGDLQSAINAVIASNPAGIADALNTTANSFAFLNYVAQQLQSAGFNAKTGVLNGNSNPNQGNLIAVWQSGDSSIERYDIVQHAGDADMTLRTATNFIYFGFTGDIPFSCIP